MSRIAGNVSPRTLCVWPLSPDIQFRRTDDEMLTKMIFINDLWVKFSEIMIPLTALFGCSPRFRATLYLNRVPPLELFRGAVCRLVVILLPSFLHYKNTVSL